MNLPIDISASSIHRSETPLPQPRAGQRGSSSTDRNIGGATNTVDTLSRDHRNGDTVSNRSRLRHQNLGNDVLRGGETWMDFLRNSTTGSLAEEQVEIATRRAAIIAADRKRRLSGQQEESSRRRSATNVSFGRLSSERTRQSLALTRNSDSVIPRSFDNPSRQRITDRPLPPTPGTASPRGIRSRDFKLPEWQADAEVSECPICGHRFNFWYRKHHCRKCGRVVCASCSPHRITIPRQFIVHPPSSSDQSFDAIATPISPHIDLTGDNEDGGPDLHATPNAYQWRNQENGIDPALGGGEEVRLCNPCVPDPNPSPHLPYTPPSRHASFSASENVVQAPQQHISSDPRQQQRLHRTYGVRSDQGFRHPRNVATAELNPERQPAHSSFTGASTSARRQSHNSVAPREFSNHPPDYSSGYGSAPDTSFHEVSLSRKRFCFSRLMSLAIREITDAGKSALTSSTPSSCLRRPWFQFLPSSIYAYC